MDIVSLIPLFGAVVVFLLVVFVFSYDQKKTKATFLFLLFSIANFAWLFFAFLLTRASLPSEALAIDRAIYLVVPFIPVLAYHFTHTLIREPTSRVVLRAGYFLATLFGVVSLVAPSLLLQGAYQYSWGYHAGAGPLHHMLALFVVLYSAITLASLVRALRRQRRPQARARARVVLVAFVNLACSALAFALAYGVDVGSWPYVGALLFSLLITYAILRYQFLGVRAFFVQVAVLVLLALSFLQVFFAEGARAILMSVILFVVMATFSYALLRAYQRDLRRQEALRRLARQLAQANVRLRELDKLKSEFLSIASHQLRTPLTAIKGYLSLVLEGTYGPLPPQFRTPLSRVFEANERLIRLVNELLNLSRIESGRMRFVFRKSDLVALVKDVVEMLSMRAHKKGLALSCDTPHHPILVDMDEEKVREVITNLVDNAIKYTPRGSVRVCVTREGNDAIVEVRDTGVGLSKDEVEHLFEKFTRGDRVERLHVSGTGLGLYVARRIAEAHHGSLTASSAGPGKGATFTLRLPLTQPVSAVAGEGEKEQEAPADASLVRA